MNHPKRKVLIICAHRPGRSPSQRYRFEQYISFLEDNGYSFEWSYLLTAQDDRIFYREGHLFGKARIMLKGLLQRRRDAARAHKFDIVFIQRESHFLGTSYFEKKAFHSGAKVIFDFDDSIWLADTSPGNKKWEWLKNASKFNVNAAHAHLVIAGNSYLAEKAMTLNKNTIVIPTTIDTSVHVPRPELRNRGRVVIGWSGSISTIRHFEMIVPVLQRLVKRYGNRIAIKVLGAAGYRHPHLPVESVAWNAATEVDELNSFDIGIMPLPDDAWARGKCGLKGLSYMACAVPAVMSPVGVNTSIISDRENGFLPGDDRSWEEVLCMLVEDSALRLRTGQAGRETVVEEYSVLRWRYAYLGAFNDPDSAVQNLTVKST